MSELKDIMGLPVSIGLDSTIEDAIYSMSENEVNVLVVIDDNWVLIWTIDIVTIMKAIVPEYIWNRDMSVASFVTEKMFEEYISDNKSKKLKYFILDTPKVINENSSILDAAIKVTEWRQTRIPVVDSENKPVWIVTRRTLKDFLSQKIKLLKK